MSRPGEEALEAVAESAGAFKAGEFALYGGHYGGSLPSHQCGVTAYERVHNGAFVSEAHHVFYALFLAEWASKKSHPVIVNEIKPGAFARVDEDIANVEIAVHHSPFVHTAEEE